MQQLNDTKLRSRNYKIPMIIKNVSRLEIITRSNRISNPEGH